MCCQSVRWTSTHRRVRPHTRDTGIPTPEHKKGGGHPSTHRRVRLPNRDPPTLGRSRDIGTPATPDQHQKVRPSLDISYLRVPRAPRRFTMSPWQTEAD